MKRIKHFLWPALIILSVTSIALSQGENTCPLIVQSALESTRLMCSGIGRNQACYGNIMLEAQPQPGVENFSFDSVGDLVDTSLIANLRLSSLDEAASQWGVALMEIQASIPDTMPQNVTLLMFGNVQIENVAVDVPNVEMQTLTNVNIRRNPALDGAIVDSADANTPVIADGRLSDNSWVRIHLPNDAVGYGWIYANGLNGDFDALTIVEPDEPSFGPMQAFTLETGVDDAPCAEAPASGILIQTPEGVGEIRIWLNQVSIRLGSTVYFQAQRGGDMTVSVLEGHAVVRVQEEIRYVPAGAQLEVPMSEDLNPAGEPTEPHAYDSVAFSAFTPTVATLPRQVAISEPIAEPQLAYYVQLNDRINNPMVQTGANGNSSGMGGSGGDGTLASTFNTATNVVDGTVNTVTNTADSTVQTVTNTVDTVTDTVANTANNAVDSVLGDGGVVDGVTDNIPGGEVVDEVASQVADTTTDVVDTVSDTVDEVTDTTDEVVDTVTDTVDDLIDDSPLGGLFGN